QLVAYLKQCAVALAKRTNSTQANSSPRTSNTPESQNPAQRDKSMLTFGHPRRIRSKEHLRYVATQPCAVCGRIPSHAHHIRYAQPRGLGLKVSDEFTVPLCAIHHRDVHTTTKERDWWQERKIDPIMIAHALWRESQSGSGGVSEAADSKQIIGQPKLPVSDDTP